VAAEVSDGKVLVLVRAFVKADTEEELGRWRPERARRKGARRKW